MRRAETGICRRCGRAVVLNGNGDATPHARPRTTDNEPGYMPCSGTWLPPEGVSEVGR